MEVFKNYSRYYNLIYKDKDYEGEANYVMRLLRKYAPYTKSLLDLGCGTGKHEIYFVKNNYKVTGVEISQEMIDIAKEELKIDNFEILLGDIRNVQLNRKFDSVLSLFHVISYQTTNEDILNTLKVVKSHLNEGGIFVFDCWYGPTVITEKPEYRIKQLEDDKIKVTRVCHPVIYPEKNTVDVNYQIIILNKSDNTTEEINETHKMRYFFTPEIEFLLNSVGLKLIHSEKWVTGEKPSFDTFSVCFVAANL
jgi:SAM-dependent methyltransferase